MSSSVKDIAELIRWAIANEKEIQVPRGLRHKNAAEGNIVYQQVAQKRSINLLANSKQTEAFARCSTLHGLLSRVLKPFPAAVKANVVVSHSKNVDFYVGGSVAQASADIAAQIPSPISVSIATLLADSEVSQVKEGILALLRERSVTGDLVFVPANETVTQRYVLLCNYHM